MKQILSKLIALHYLLFMVIFFASTTFASSTIGGTFSTTSGGQPLTPVTISTPNIDETWLIEFDGGLARNYLNVSERTNLYPTQEYAFRFSISDGASFEQLTRVSVKMFYTQADEITKALAFGTGSYGSGVTNETDGSGLSFVWEWNYADNAVTSGVVYESGLDASISTWTRNLSDLRAPSTEFMTASGTDAIDFDFVIPIQISKIAKLAENRNWHIAVLVEKDNSYATAGFAHAGEYGVTWYGEISIDSPNAFVWPLDNTNGTELNPGNKVLFGSDFSDDLNDTSLNVRYISNGNYEKTIQSSGMTWTSNVSNPLDNGNPFTATLVETSPQSPQTFAIRYNESGISSYADSMPFLNDTSRVIREKNSFTSSLETGDLYNYNLFLSLAPQFQNGTYAGFVNLGMRDPFYVILNTSDGEYYAGTTATQLSQSFVNAQDAADQAVIDLVSGQTIKLLREITANLYIPVGAINNLANYSADRQSFILDFDKHRLNGNIFIEGFGNVDSSVFLSGLGIISGTLTLDGRNLSVTSDAEVMGQTLIRNTSLSSYSISERHHDDIIVGLANQGRTRIVSTSERVQPNVVIQTVERIFFEGQFDSVNFNNNSTSFNFDSHARFDNATVNEIIVSQNAEIYIANGSSITSGFITPSGNTARIYLESGASIAGTVSDEGEDGAARLYTTFTGSGTYELTEFEDNIVNMSSQLSYPTLQLAVNFAEANDILRIREVELNELVTVTKALVIEGIQRDYNAFERYVSIDALRFRNRGESVLVNTMNIIASGVTINGVKFDLATGKQVTSNADDTTFDYLWVTKSHAQAGIEAAVLITNVSGLLIDQSAFVRIASTVANENRHGILLSGVLNNIHIQYSNFERIAGKNIGVTGASFENVQFNNNTHERSIDGNTDNDAMIHIVNREFKNALIQNINMINPFIRGIVVQTPEISSVVENITINNVRAYGDNANQLYSNILFANTAAGNSFRNIEINNSQFKGVLSANESHIVFTTMGHNVLYDDITIQANILTSDSNASFIRLASNDNNSGLVTWSGITIRNNNIQHQVINGILLSQASNQSGLFQNVVIHNNIINDSLINTGIRFDIDSFNSQWINPTITNNTIDVTSAGTGILFDIDDSKSGENTAASFTNLTISGNNEIDGNIGIYFDTRLAQPLFDGLIITNNSIGSTSSQYGILIEADSYSRWLNVDIYQNGSIEAHNNSTSAGIQIKAEGNATFDSLKIRNHSGEIGSSSSNASGSRNGIVILTDGDPTFNNLQITANTNIHGNAQGIMFKNESDAARFNNLIISSNNINANGNGDGIFFDIRDGSIYSGLTIQSNTLVAIDDQGIQFTTTSGAVLSGVVILSNTMNSGDDGIVISNTGPAVWNDLTLSGNTITVSNHGIDLSATSTATLNNYVLRNNTVNASDIGIRLHSNAASTWNIDIRSNNLSHGGNTGVLVDWTSGVVNVPYFELDENSIGYDIGLLADSFDINPLVNVTDNTFTSSEWYIKDVQPNLATYTEIRSGVLVANNNSYDEEAYISFSNDRNPNGIRPEDQFNVWNDTRFYGFLDAISSDDNAQFQIAVDNLLAQEDDVIRINNNPTTDDGEFKLSEFAGPPPAGGTQGLSFFGYAFKVEYNTTLTGMIGGMDGSAVGAIYAAAVTEDGSLGQVESLLASGLFASNTREQRILFDTPVQLQADRWYYMAQGRAETNAQHYQIGTIDVSSLISNSILSAFSTENLGGIPTQAYFWGPDAVNDDATAVIGATRNVVSINPALGLIYDAREYYDFSDISINTSGLTIYSATVNSQGSGIQPAFIRNIPQTGVTAQSGVIFNINAPGVTVENLSFEHGFTNYSATAYEGVVEVHQSNVTLSGLRFISYELQDIAAISVLNNSGAVNNVVIDGVEIGSGALNTSYQRGIVVRAENNSNTISGLVIGSGFIHTGTAANHTAVLFSDANGSLISNSLITNNTLSANNVGIRLDTLIGAISIQNNNFTNNTTHLVDDEASITSLRNDVLTGQSNTFGPAVNENAFVNNALVVGNTITSAQQNFTNVEKLEAYTTLQEAINDAAQGQTIKVRSNATFSDATLSTTNSGTVIVNVSGLTITSVNPETLATIRNTDASDAPVFDLQASGITITNIAITRSSGIISSSGTGAIQINNQFITLSGIQFDAYVDHSSSALNAIGFDNSGLASTSGLVISNNRFNGTWASMVEFVNHYDSGVIEATISNNEASGAITFVSKDNATTSGIINMIAFNDILVRLDAFDTVTLTSNTFGSSGIDKTLIPIFDVLSFNNLGSTVTTATGLTSGLYTTATWNLVETALALPEQTNVDNQSKLSQLTAALSGLVLQASFTALEIEVNFSSGLLEDDFTNPTFDIFSGVFATSSGLLNTHSDTTVDNSDIVQATTDLIDAMRQLEFISEVTLSGIVNATLALDASNFIEPDDFVTTRTSGIELLAQISTSGVMGFYENNSVRLNETVSGLATLLLEEVSGLTFRGLDASAIEQFEFILSLVESNFTELTWQPFDVARSSGSAIINAVTSSGAFAFFDGVALTSGVIVEVSSNLNATTNALVFQGIVELNELVNVTTSGLDLSNYTSTSRNPFIAARKSGTDVTFAVGTANVTAMFDGSFVTSGVITTVQQNLLDAFNNLVFEFQDDLNERVNVTTSGLLDSDHTSQSWAVFDAARTSGIAILDAITASKAVAQFDGVQLTSGVIASIDTAINNAFLGLVLQPSFTALEEEVNFSSGLIEADFTSPSFNIFSGVFDASSGILNTHALTSVTNSVVLDATTDLINAMIQLEFVSEATLSGLLEATSGLDTSNYIDPAAFSTTKASGIDLFEQISTSGVKAFYEDAFVVSNVVVSGLSNDLQTRLNELVFIHFSGLQAEVNLVSGLLESNFEENQWSAFEIARTSGLTINTNVTNVGALALFDSVALTSGTILDITNAMQTARSNLALSGFEVLSGLVNITTSGLNQASYTTVTFDPFNIVRDSGILIVDAVRTSGALAVFEANPLSSGVIAFITSGLTNRFHALSFVGSDPLSELVNITTSGLDQSNYTNTTWTPFDTARTSGINILNAITSSGAVAQVDGVDVSNTMISSVNTALTNGFNNLVFEGQVILSGLVAQVTLLDSNNFSGVIAFDAARTSGTTIIDAITASGAVAQFNTIQLTSGVISQVFTALDDATSGLVFVGFETLSGFVNGLTSGIELSNFTTDSLATFNAARTSGLNLYNNIVASGAFATVDGTLVTRDLIDTAHSVLFNAFTSLVFENEVALGIVVNESSGLIESNFTPTPWTTFINSFNTASGTFDVINTSVQEALNTSITSGAIETQRINLITARSGLVFLGADALDTAINVTTSGLDVSNFTDSGAFVTAQSSGLAILAGIEAKGPLAIFEGVVLSSGAIEDVTNALLAAYNGLVFTNFNTLSGLVTSSSGLNEIDFTTATWNPYQVVRDSGVALVQAIVDSGVRSEFGGATVTSGLILSIATEYQSRLDQLVFSGIERLVTAINLTSGIEADSGLYVFNTLDESGDVVVNSYQAFELAYNSGFSVLTSINSSTRALSVFDGTRVSSALIVSLADAIELTSGQLILKSLYEPFAEFANYALSLEITDFTTESVDAVSAIDQSAMSSSGINAIEIFYNPVSNEDVIDANLILISQLMILRLSGIEVLAELIDQSSGILLLNNEYTSASLTVFEVARDSGILVGTQIITSGALGLYEGVFITSGVLNQSIQDLDDALEGLRFANFAQFEATLNTVTTDIVANSGVYTTDSYNTFDLAYQSGLIYQTAITASGVFARVNDVQVVNADLIAINNAILSASGALENQVVETSLAIFYDAQNDLSYSGDGTVWADLSENNNNATLSNVTYSAQFGGILQFNGTNAFGYTTDIVESPGPQVFTIETWIRPTDSGVGKIIGFETSSGTSTSFDRHLYINSNGDLAFGIFSTTAKSITYSGLEPSEWSHVVATYSSGIEEMNLYVNGVLVASGTVGTAQTYSGIWRFGGGTLNGTWGVGSSTPEVYYYDGDIGEIRIYDIALSANQVTQNYNATRDRFFPAPVLLTSLSQIEEYESSYLIDSTSGLIALRDYVNQGSGTTELSFTMISDVSLSGLNWASIGNASDRSFNGVFDGSGFAIQDLYASGISSGYQGLFGQVGSTGLVNNIVVESGIISGAGINVGLLVGLNQGTVQNATVLGNVIVNNTASNAGGFIGRNQGTITNILYDVDSLAMTNTAQYTGGFVGYNTSGISNVVFNASNLDVTSTDKTVGGFVGFNDENALINLISFDLIDAVIENDHGDGVLGGFVANNNGTISNVRMSVENNIELDAYGYVGGFAGRVSLSSKDSTIQNILMVIDSGLTITSTNNNNGFFIGGAPFSSSATNIITSGVFISIDLSIANKPPINSNGVLIGQIDNSNTIEINSVFYTSGVTSSGQYNLIEVGSVGYLFEGDQVASSGLLSEVTSGFILNVINADDVFIASGNDFPIFKDIGIITASLQREIAIPWID